VKLKIKREELDRLQEDPLELFYQGIKSSATKDKYTRTFVIFYLIHLKTFLEGDFKERTRQFVKMAKKSQNGLSRYFLPFQRSSRKELC